MVILASFCTFQSFSLAWVWTWTVSNYIAQMATQLAYTYRRANYIHDRPSESGYGSLTLVSAKSHLLHPGNRVKKTLVPCKFSCWPHQTFSVFLWVSLFISLRLLLPAYRRSLALAREHRFRSALIVPSVLSYQNKPETLSPGLSVPHTTTRPCPPTATCCRPR